MALAFPDTMAEISFSIENVEHLLLSDLDVVHTILRRASRLETYEPVAKSLLTIFKTNHQTYELIRACVIQEFELLGPGDVPFRHDSIRSYILVSVLKPELAGHCRAAINIMGAAGKVDPAKLVDKLVELFCKEGYSFSAPVVRIFRFIVWECQQREIRWLTKSSSDRSDRSDTDSDSDYSKDPYLILNNLLNLRVVCPAVIQSVQESGKTPSKCLFDTLKVFCRRCNEPDIGKRLYAGKLELHRSLEYSTALQSLTMLYNATPNQ